MLVIYNRLPLGIVNGCASRRVPVSVLFKHLNGPHYIIKIKFVFRSERAGHGSPVLIFLCSLTSSLWPQVACAGDVRSREHVLLVDVCSPFPGKPFLLSQKKPLPLVCVRTASRAWRGCLRARAFLRALREGGVRSHVSVLSPVVNGNEREMDRGLLI